MKDPDQEGDDDDSDLEVLYVNLHVQPIDIPDSEEDHTCYAIVSFLISPVCHGLGEPALKDAASPPEKNPSSVRRTLGWSGTSV